MSNIQTFTYGMTPDDVITKAATSECPDGEYSVEVHAGSDDFGTIQSAVNQGIDSHLEAVFFEEFEGAYGRRGFRFTTESLHVLCRRLGEADDENAQDFRQGILQTLDIEEI